MGATGSHFYCVYTGSAAWVPLEPVADSQDHKRQRQAEKMVFSPIKKEPMAPFFMLVTLH
jgi:hypothetical protein